MALRDFIGNLFGPIPEPVAISPKNLNNAWRQGIARDSRAVRTLDPSSEFPDWDTQVLRAFNMWSGGSANYRIPNVSQALSTPAIFRAVSLIANTTGSLAVTTYRNGVELTGSDVPRLVTRPDPFRTPNVFYRNTAFDLAAYGEAWWWVAKRDADGLAASLINVPPWEITVDDSLDRLHPVITWNIKGNIRQMPPDDMRQITFLPNPAGGLRGVGPLQLCRAATSVSVESQEWAANFYAEGGYPSLVIKAASPLGENEDGELEADLLRNQFMGKAHNTPRVIDEGIEDVTEFGVNPQGAQMLEARQQNKGDAANMFGIPGVLLEYSAPGSSLTYQNVQEVFRLFVQSSLSPGYLEKIEQELTDLLPRQTTARFNLSGFDRADAKSRWETYNLMVPVLGPEEAATVARVSEGLQPGDIEFAPVPFAPPAAFPSALPGARATRTAEAVRCTGSRFIGGIRKPCNKLLAEAGPFTGRCPRCGTPYGGVLSA